MPTRFRAALLISILGAWANAARAEPPPDAYDLDLLDDQLTRWVVTDCEVAYEQGVLTTRAGNGFVRSAHRYADFVLEADWKPLKDRHWDSGIYFRCDVPPAGQPWPTRYQINLKAGQEGDLLGVPGLTGQGIAKAGEWNHLRLTAVGPRATLEINGQQAWTTDAIEPASGFIGIQVETPEGGAFEFRDIRVRELGFRPLFNALDLTGWEGAEQDAGTCWQVANGELLCTGEPGPWLRSREEFGDFNLRLEYKVRAGGNSGVYARVPADGNHHGDGAGVEIQILDDAAEQYRDLQPYQYSGSVYAIAPATRRVSRAAESWNTLELDCRGDSYRVLHNGVSAVSVAARDYPALAGRLKRGFLGLQNHSEKAWFRHVRVGPSLLPPDTPPPVQQLLSRRIVEDDRAVREVREFCRPRVARLPSFDSTEAWTQYAERVRSLVRERVVFRGEATRWRTTERRVEWLDELDPAPEYRLRKLRYEALPGLWVPAVLYEPKNLTDKTPVVLNVNGHDPNGKAAPYKQIRCINLAKRGLLALNLEWLGMGQLQGEGAVHYRMNQLDLCGTSGLAPFVLALERGLDVLLDHPHADPSRVAVAGLSGGGWQTIAISALDTRVALANPVAGYSSFLTRLDNFSDLGDSEQTPTDLAAYADYTHLTAMLAPRAALLTYNAKDDCCFAADHALPPLLEAARPVYRLFQAEDRLRSHVNTDPGNHNFERDNREAFYRAIAATFYSQPDSFPTTEIECQAEVQTAEQLQVPLPEPNQDFHSLALALAAQLPRDADWPAEATAARDWQTSRTTLLSRTLRYHGDYDVQSQQVATEPWHDCTVTYWKLAVGSDWTVPAVEFSPPQPEGTILLFSEQGRTSTGPKVHEGLRQNRRVVAIDPFFWGENKITERDFLFALLVASVGERLAGVQASQVNGIACWLALDRGLGPIQLEADGPRAALIGLLAAALDRRAIGGVRVHNGLGSLREVLERNLGVNEAPEYFCFGLLEQFDMRHLVALAAPREIQFVAPSDRVRQELQALPDFYRLWGKEFTPVP